MPKPQIFDIPATLIRESRLALLLRVDVGKDVWFPKSQVEFDGKTLTVPGYLLEEKGLDYLV